MTTSPAAASKHTVVLDALNRCIAACEHCATSCLHEEHVQHMVPCILLDRDCSDVCALTARLVARGSEHAKHLMRECIEICTKCANECSQHEDEHCQQCAAACQACVEACQRYLE
ncbi:hypothetical protein GCM10027346_27380 [Hymenobacter seoulensis]